MLSLQNRALLNAHKSEGNEGAAQNLVDTWQTSTSPVYDVVKIGQPKLTQDYESNVKHSEEKQS